MSREICKKSCKKNTPAWYDSFPESVFVIDCEGTILDANEAFADRFQKSPQECIGNNVYDLLAPEIASHRREKAKEVFGTKRMLSWEDKRNNCIVHHTIYPTLSRDGEVTHLLIIAQDVTELKMNNEQAISKTIIDAIPGTFYYCRKACQ